jgi:hypothetical protein
MSIPPGSQERKAFTVSTWGINSAKIRLELEAKREIN